MFNEHSRLEAKKALGGIPESLWESYSAFANTEGGIILLGVSEVDSGLVVTGVKEGQKKIKTIWDILNNRGKISANVLMEKHIYIQRVNDCDVIVIDVPRADRHDKPVYINNDLFEGTYRRNAEGDYRCSKQEVKAMLRDQSDLPIDSKVIDELSWKSLDIESLSRYRNRFSSLKPAHVWNSLDNIEFLNKTGCIRKNEKGEFSPTLAGLLMFGTDDVITQILPDYFLDYREKYDENRWSDRVVSNMGEWSGNIFDFFFKIADRLTADIKRPFLLRSHFEREDDPAVNVAIREALANTLIHADYYGRQGIVVEKRKGEIRFSNPGICRPGISEVREGGVSDPRNPTIFKLFALIEIGERAGSGIFSICAVWNEIGWREPVMFEKFSPERTNFVIPTAAAPESGYLLVEEPAAKYIITPTRHKKTTGNNTENVKNNTENSTEQKNSTGSNTENALNNTENNTEKLSKSQKEIIRQMSNNPFITSEQMSVIVGITADNVRVNIGKLKAKGLVKRVGSAKGGYWQVTNKSPVSG